jgi:hypothetical protein
LSAAHFQDERRRQGHRAGTAAAKRLRSAARRTSSRQGNVLSFFRQTGRQEETEATKPCKELNEQRVPTPTRPAEACLFLSQEASSCFLENNGFGSTGNYYYSACVWLTRVARCARRRKRVVVCLRFVTPTTQLVPTLGLRRISSCSAISTQYNKYLSRFGFALQKNKYAHGELPVSQNVDASPIFWFTRGDSAFKVILVFLLC